jgi:hypothetical protein
LVAAALARREVEERVDLASVPATSA